MSKDVFEDYVKVIDIDEFGFVEYIYFFIMPFAWAISDEFLISAHSLGYLGQKSHFRPKRRKSNNSKSISE